MSDESIPRKQCYRKEQCLHPEGPWLPATTKYFNIRKASKDGFNHICKACRHKDRLDAYWFDVEESRRKQHHATIRLGKDEKLRLEALGLRRCSKCHAELPADIEHFGLHKGQLYSQCRICHRQAKGDSNKRNRASANKRNQRWRQRHPEKALSHVHTRRARLEAAEGSYTPEDLEIQLRMQTDKKGIARCWWCNQPLKDDKTIDHRVPLSRGGTNWPSNLVIAHFRCNTSKNNRLPHEWSDRLL